MPRHKAAFLVVLSCIGAIAIGAVALSTTAAQNILHGAAAAPTASEDWDAVAPGRVEPRSGEIRISAPMMARISAVLVRPGDKIFAGEALVTFDDSEARARVASARAQIAVRKRTRNEQPVTGRALDRRRAEDAVADAEDDVIAGRNGVDKAAMARRRDISSESDLEAARKTLEQAQDRLSQSRGYLRKLEADSATPLPTQLEGQLSIARTELQAAEAGLERLIIRSPVDAVVLQVNAKAGEFGNPGALQPLVSVGDVSALRVRAELDEDDYGAVKPGEAVVVRSDAFRGRDFAGTVVSIAPLIQSGRLGGPGQRNLTDVNVAEVLIDLTEPRPLAVGMKVDVYFRELSTGISAK